MAYKEKQSNWQPTAERFITFIDIMGFKDLVARSEHKEVYTLLSGIDDKKDKRTPIEFLMIR